MTTAPPILLASALSDNATLVLLTIVGAAPVVLAGAWLTRRRGGVGAGAQALVVALAPVVATWVGALIAARAMFISPHDLTALGVIAATGCAIGLLSAWRLARRIRRDASALGRMSRSIAAGDEPDDPKALAMTELATLGDELNAMSRDLSAAHERELALERSRRELVAWVSHDLRSPLAAIRAMAEALEDGVVQEPGDVAHYLRSIGAETDRLTLLVDDLFELSRITSGTIDLTPRPVPASDLLGSVVDGVRATARSHGINLSCLGDVTAMLFVSPTEAERVLRNLVDNAIRHTPRGGEIVLQLGCVEHHAVVEVIDQCGGIPPADLERVFDVAFRGDVARGRDDGGGGLGLAIAKGLAEAQSGSIDVSNRGGGCCFSVRFPLAVAR